MSALAFDTHKAVMALKQAGFEEAQAEALGGNVATKADLTEVRAVLEADMVAVKADIEQLRSETKADLAAVRADMETLRADMAEQFTALYKQLWLMAVGIVGLTVTLVKLIP